MRHPWYFEAHHQALVARLDQEIRPAILAEPLFPADGGTWEEVEEARRSARALEFLAEHDLCQYAVPQAGSPFDGRAVCLIREALGWASGLVDFVFAMQGLGSHALVLGGSEAQRAAWLPRVAAGEAVGAFALTERQAGSDVSAIATTARRDGGDYVLDGGKRFISNAGLADFYVVFARTGEGRGGLSAFLVEADCPGLTVVRHHAVMAPHPLGDLGFEGCRIPVAQRIGDEGGGWGLAMGTLDRFRPSVGAAALGMGRRAFDEATSRAKSRVQFGRPLAKQQLIQQKLAQMDLRLEGARLLVFQAAYLADQGNPLTTREAALGKLAATEAAHWVVDQALQIFGGEGAIRGSVVERLYREVRPLRIYEGTSEIQHLIIARHALKRILPEGIE